MLIYLQSIYFFSFLISNSLFKTSENLCFKFKITQLKKSRRFSGQVPFLSGVYLKSGYIRLGILLEEIRDVRLENTFLGRRSLFYLSKMYVEGAHAGDDYSLLKKCIVICVLGYKWDACPDYHKICSLKDQNGWLYSDQFEVHVIELDKELTGDRLDDWIRLFRVENMEELNMIQSTNPGVMEAMREVMEMNMGRRLKALYEEHMRIKRDRLYLRNAAIQEGRREEERLGDLNRRRQDILELLEDLGEVPEDIRLHIQSETDVDILCKWLKAAARAGDLAAFRDAIK